MNAAVAEAMFSMEHGMDQIFRPEPSSNPNSLSNFNPRSTYIFVPGYQILFTHDADFGYLLTPPALTVQITLIYPELISKSNVNSTIDNPTH